MQKEIKIPENDKVAAIVILYLPTENSLIRLLLTIQGIVNYVCIVNNTPTQQITWVSNTWFAAHGFEVLYQALGDNLGIAKAQNVGIEMATQAGCDHVILFDQDSEATEGMVATLLAQERLLLKRGVKVGSVGPVYIDEKTGEYASAYKQSIFFERRAVKINAKDISAIDVTSLIASGSLIRTSVLQEVGGMSDELFIDWVDIEWSLRAGRFGYSHFMIPTTVMRHKIGDSFLNIGIKKINIHNDVRKYYIIRNACFLLISKDMSPKWRLVTAFKIPTFILIYLIISKKKIKLIKLMWTAVKHGFCGRLGRANISI